MKAQPWNPKATVRSHHTGRMHLTCACQWPQADRTVSAKFPKDSRHWQDVKMATDLATQLHLENCSLILLSAHQTQKAQRAAALNFNTAAFWQNSGAHTARPGVAQPHSNAPVCSGQPQSPGKAHLEAPQRQKIHDQAASSFQKGSLHCVRQTERREGAPSRCQGEQGSVSPPPHTSP